MSGSIDSVAEPVAISLIAGRYLLFDVNVVTYLRRTHHICGVLTGSIPQIPQQNIFMGLPLELMPEEARLLIEKKVAYIVDDTTWHKQRFNPLDGSDRRQYLDSLRSEGLKARRFAEASARKRSEIALSKLAAGRRSETSAQDSVKVVAAPNGNAAPPFNDNQVTSRASTRKSRTTDEPWPVTPTTTCLPLSLPQNLIRQPDVPVSPGYPLFAHMHSRDYYLMPGLRFGCDYNVYPGDPLRFHSHFSAVSYGWGEEISMIDLIGGGRLGTRVKKSLLIGGKDTNSEAHGADNVRTFCIEWGGM